jgi:hypothetical protein
MKYIQSFYQYPVTFSSVKKTIPARAAVGDMKNIAEFSEAELENMTNAEPFFRELLNKKKLRILNHIPQAYIPPAQQVNEANANAEKLQAENEALKARLAELEALAQKNTEAASTSPAEETTESAEKKARKRK